MIKPKDPLFAFQCHRAKRTDPSVLLVLFEAFSMLVRSGQGVDDSAILWCEGSMLLLGRWSRVESQQQTIYLPLSFTPVLTLISFLPSIRVIHCSSSVPTLELHPLFFLKLHSFQRSAGPDSPAPFDIAHALTPTLIDQTLGYITRHTPPPAALSLSSLHSNCNTENNAAPSSPPRRVLGVGFGRERVSAVPHRDDEYMKITIDGTSFWIVQLDPLATTRLDPIISPGEVSMHGE